MGTQWVEVFFGEMGSGKSWCGRCYAGWHGYEFFEGDDVVTRELLDRSGRFKPIPRGVIREFVRVLAAETVKRARATQAPTLVVAQALYLDEDRRVFAQLLREEGVYVRTWHWVRTPFFKHVRNLLTRKERWRWVGYMLMNKPFFQAPVSHDYEDFPNG